MNPVRMYTTQVCPFCVRAKALLRKAGHANVVAVAGGTAAWREASLPIEKSAA